MTVNRAAEHMPLVIGPSWVGRVIARWMLDLHCPDRAGRYISPAIPRYPMMPEGVFPVARPKEMQRLQWQLARMREQNHVTVALADLNGYLHANPDVMALWLEGWPGSPPGPVR